MPTKQVDFRDAHYQCDSCNHRWTGGPGAITCIKCNHLYAKWLNYEACSKAYHSIGTHSPLEDNAFGGPYQALSNTPRT